MRDAGSRDWRIYPFLLKSERPMEGELLAYLRSTKGVQPERWVPPEEDRWMPDLPGGPWDFPSMTKMRRERYVLAVVGGLILTAPMVLMVLVPRVDVSLITAVVCTMAFAVAAAYFSPTKLPIELLAATATYAAVLVVFVGAVTGSCDCKTD